MCSFVVFFFYLNAMLLEGFLKLCVCGECVCVCLCVCGVYMFMQCLWRPEEGGRSPEAGTTSLSELPNACTGS